MKHISILFAMFFSGFQVALAQQPAASLVPFSTGFTLPLGIENCRDGRLFIVEKGGKIIICDSAGVKQATPFLDISTHIKSRGDEQGLLGLAFDPKYLTNGYFYVNYTDVNSNTQISRFRVSSSNPNKANPASEKLILNIIQPYGNHNGGCLRFAPDGYLYIATGDGGSAGDPQNNAQNKTSLLGKILRIDVHSGLPYKIPPTNPFVNTEGYSKEIWALGMRNPWRFSFDAQNGNLWIGDVGQSLWEEIDMETSKGTGGKNYGWRCYEGNHAYDTSGCQSQLNYTSPVSEYPHANNDCSVTGGYVYRGKKYPTLYGKYIYCDYCSGTFKMLTKQGGNWLSTNLFTSDAYSFASFGEDRNKELYVANYTNGIIYRFTDAAANIAINSFSADAVNSQPGVFKIYPNPSQGNFNIEYQSQKEGQVTILIYNSLGNLVYTKNKLVKQGLNAWSIALAKTLKGNYFIKIFDGKGFQYSQKLMLK